MSRQQFQCTVITPERQVFDAPADSVTLPAYDGEIGILLNRAPLLCKLGIGLLRIRTGGDLRRMYVDGGFAQMLDNKLVVLTERAAAPDDIDPDAEEAALAQARNRRTTDLEAQADRRRDIERASAKLKLVR